MRAVSGSARARREFLLDALCVQQHRDAHRTSDWNAQRTSDWAGPLAAKKRKRGVKMVEKRKTPGIEHVTYR